jgi:hypothetical protein
VIPACRPVSVFPLHGFDVYDERAVIVGTVATTAIITEPADFGADARETLIELRDCYNADT